MEKLMKRFSMRLALCLLLVSLLAVTVSAASLENCPGSCAHQAALGTTHYDFLSEAVAAAEPGKTITLLTDVSVPAPLTFDKSLSLDLGGKTLTGNLVFLEGGSLRNGKLVATDGACLTVKNCTVAIEKDAQLEGCGTAPVVDITADKDKKAIVNVSGVLTGEGTAPVVQVLSAEGSCELYILEGAQLAADTNSAIAFDSAGKLDISGGKLQGKKDLISLCFAKDRQTEIAITGGELLCEEGEILLITGEEDAKIPEDFVTGGTFSKVPTDYMPDHAKVTTNSDGTVTVISSYKITFLSGGASGSMEPVSVKCGSSYTLPQPAFTPSQNMDFVGWSIGGKIYAPGAALTPTADITATAQWEAHIHSGGKATCTARAVCDGCGKAYGQLGSHSLSYQSGYEASCDSTGMLSHNKCIYCGGRFISGVGVSYSTLVLPAPGHDWETIKGTPATCTEEGLKEHRICKHCKELQLEGAEATKEDLKIPALGHTTEKVAATQATCSQPGMQAHERCSVCDGLFVNSQSVTEADLTTALSSHVLSDWVCDGQSHWKACVDCDAVFRQSAHTDTDADSSCDDCGYAMATEPVETVTPPKHFSWLFLIPIFIAAVIGIILAAKKRK